MIKAWLKKQFLATLLLAVSLAHSGCLWLPGNRVDISNLNALREKNFNRDIRAMDPMAATGETENEEDTQDPGRGKQYTPVINGPLTLEDAIAYATKYNLEAAVEKLQREVMEEAAVGAKLKMLPALTAAGEIGRRDSYAASFSDPLFTEGAEAYNYSRDKSAEQFHLELSWSLLDFGIAYYQHKQGLSRVNIAEQRRQRVIQNLKFDVTRTFWQAQVSKAAVKAARKLVGRLEEREQILGQQLESEKVSEIDVLETAAALLEMQMQMDGFERELHKYKLQLASLMGLADSVEFELADADFDSPIRLLRIDSQELERAALHERPELIEQDLEELLTLDEARIALAKMAPTPTAYARWNYDGDSHLYYDSWYEAGLKVSFDLLSVPRKMSERAEILKKQEVVKKQRLALAAAILTQLNIALVDYDDSLRKYDQNKQIDAKRRQLMEARGRHCALGKGRIEDALMSEARYLFSRVQTLSAYADVIVAEKRILNTIGCDDCESLLAFQKEALAPAPFAVRMEAETCTTAQAVGAKAEAVPR